MDLYETKSRIAEALVESIYRRARYQVRPYGAGDPPLRVGRDDFSPSFYVSPEHGDGSEPSRLIEVKYRPFVEQFMALETRRGRSSIVMLAWRRWPGLTLVLVTDHPEAGRSCFQAVSPATEVGPLTTVDLAAVKDFDIYARNIADHEGLLERIFRLLTAL